MRLRVDRPLARSAADFRTAAGIMVRHGAPHGLLAFRVVDTHLHALFAAPRRDAGVVTQIVESALNQSLRFPAPFDAARFRPVADLHHLRAAVLYVLRQTERHGANVDRAHDGSSLPDVLGMRCIDAGAWSRLLAALPRLGRDQLLPLLPIELEARVPFAPEHLADAAAAALGLPSLSGNRPEAVLGRRAAIAIGEAHLGVGELAEAIGSSVHSVRRLRSARGELPQALVVAVRRQLAVRTALHGAKVDHLMLGTPTFAPRPSSSGVDASFVNVDPAAFYVDAID
jgi:hypothetical protein